MVCFQGKGGNITIHGCDIIWGEKVYGFRNEGMNEELCICVHVIPCYVKECYMGAVELLASQEQAGLLLDDLC